MRRACKRRAREEQESALRSTRRDAETRAHARRIAAPTVLFPSNWRSPPLALSALKNDSMHMHVRLTAVAAQRRAALPRAASSSSSRPPCLFADIAIIARATSGGGERAAPSPEDQAAPAAARRRTRERRRADAAVASTGASDDDAADADDADAPTTKQQQEEAALRRAVRLVDYRERSSGELLRRLRESAFSEPAARLAIARLEASGLVDDRRFAEAVVAWRFSQRAEAPRAIRRALLAAGVPPQVGEEALEAFFGADARVVRPYGERGGGDEEEEEDDDDGSGGARARWRALVAASREQARRSESVAPEKRRARLARWLAARGHSWDTVTALVREVGL